jgi:membrane protease subunit HflK
MEEILSRPEIEKVIISNESMKRVFPLLPLQRSGDAGMTGLSKEGGAKQ